MANISPPGATGQIAPAGSRSHDPPVQEHDHPEAEANVVPCLVASSDRILGEELKLIKDHLRQFGYDSATIAEKTAFWVNYPADHQKKFQLDIPRTRQQLQDACREAHRSTKLRRVYNLAVISPPKRSIIRSFWETLGFSQGRAWSTVERHEISTFKKVLNAVQFCWDKHQRITAAFVVIGAFLIYWILSW